MFREELTNHRKRCREPISDRGKPDGGCAENPVRSERKQRYRLLPGVRFPLKGAFTSERAFYFAPD